MGSHLHRESVPARGRDTFVVFLSPKVSDAIAEPIYAAPPFHQLEENDDEHFQADNEAPHNILLGTRKPAAPRDGLRFPGQPNSGLRKTGRT